MNILAVRHSVALSSLIVAGCGGSGGGTPHVDAGVMRDASVVTADSGPRGDAGLALDAAPHADAGSSTDSGSAGHDSGTAMLDSGPSSDANMSAGDANTSDGDASSAHDAGLDAGAHDAGPIDAGCARPTTDTGNIGLTCTPPTAGVCGAGYSCTDMVGIVTSYSCQIPCATNCDCPTLTVCMQRVDKRGTHSPFVCVPLT